MVSANKSPTEARVPETKVNPKARVLSEWQIDLPGLWQGPRQEQTHCARCCRGHVYSNLGDALKVHRGKQVQVLCSGGSCPAPDFPQGFAKDKGQGQREGTAARTLTTSVEI